MADIPDKSQLPTPPSAASPSADGRFKSGDNAYPLGRPKKKRPLTELLSEAGAKNVQKYKVSFGQLSKEESVELFEERRKFLAEKLWELAVYGTTVLAPLPGTTEAREIKVVSLDAWMDIAKFLYNQIDGPPAQSHEVVHEVSELSMQQAYSALLALVGANAALNAPEQPPIIVEAETVESDNKDEQS